VAPGSRPHHVGWEVTLPNKVSVILAELDSFPLCTLDTPSPTRVASMSERLENAGIANTNAAPAGSVE
jgi:hypothetical protein